MLEEWKQIEDFPRYEVSNLGNIRSNIGKQKILKGWISENGYVLVKLSNKPKEKGKYQRKDFKLHRLVAKYFCEGYSDNKEVHHIDLDRKNNSSKNLLPLTKNEHIDLHKKLRQQEKEANKSSND